MTGEEWALAASVVFAGLWSGLLGMLVLVLHKMLVQGAFGLFLVALIQL